jgi:hypothetical protein
MNNKKFHFRREVVYYVEIDTRKTLRNKTIAGIIGEQADVFFIGAGKRVGDIETLDINRARFWKDKKSAEWAAKKFPDTIQTIKEMSLDDYVNNIDPGDGDDYVSKRNQKNLRIEKKYLEEKAEFLKNYKCTGVYKPPTAWDEWLKCPNCKLQPLVWEFDNGSSTACGCGENNYNHFSIHSESVNSLSKHISTYTMNRLRDNWNHWVQTGVVLFDIKKERENGRW